MTLKPRLASVSKITGKSLSERVTKVEHKVKAIVCVVIVILVCFTLVVWSLVDAATVGSR